MRNVYEVLCSHWLNFSQWGNLTCMYLKKRFMTWSVHMTYNVKNTTELFILYINLKLKKEHQPFVNCTDYLIKNYNLHGMFSFFRLILIVRHYWIEHFFFIFQLDKFLKLCKSCLVAVDTCNPIFVGFFFMRVVFSCFSLSGLWYRT